MQHTIEYKYKKIIIIIGKHPSPTSTRDKINIGYISEGQPSPFELTFGVELGPNSHSKIVSNPNPENNTKTQTFPIPERKPPHPILTTSQNSNQQLLGKKKKEEIKPCS